VLAQEPRKAAPVLLLLELDLYAPVFGHRSSRSSGMVRRG
jgi:hypothetical protein